MQLGTFNVSDKGETLASTVVGVIKGGQLTVLQ
jgi:hypothetical protein